jgi:GNAT superfamily N-acetyltransferase
MIEALGIEHLEEARAVLRAACAFDRAAEVAEEKLWGDSPAGPAVAWGARVDGALVGVAAATGARLRVLAVTPEARGRGIGGALLDATGATRTLDLPGNYLAPGIDERNVEAIGWLERRGWTRKATNTNLLIDVCTNPRVTTPPARDGYEVRRAGPDDAALIPAIAAEFGGAWPFEVDRALDGGGVHVAIAADGGYAAFAAHDGNNAGLGWFGPAGTWPAHRGKGLGEALLLACLIDVATHHDVCEVAWIGPRAFYERVAGIAGERRFVVLTKESP